MNDLYPDELPLALKPIWFYDDCFPRSAALKLTSVFLHRNYEMDMHTHDFFELNVTINGKGAHYANGRRYEITAGDVVIVPPECYHGYHKSSELNVFHVLLHKNYFLKYAGDLNTLSAFRILFNESTQTDNRIVPVFRIDGEPYDRVLNLLWQLDELERKTNLSAERSDYLLSYSLTFALIVLLCKEYTRQYVSEDRSDDTGIIAASEYIHKNYAQKIMLDELCSIGMMSKTLLCDKFKRYYGYTPLEYVNRYRVLVAKNMIIETDKSITEIAQETGFFDASHFLKTYRKYENVNPADLRTQLLSSLNINRNQ